MGDYTTAKVAVATKSGNKSNPVVAFILREPRFLHPSSLVTTSTADPLASLDHA
jgi:hypothetical protein